MAASALYWDLGLTEDKADGMLRSYNGGSGICHYHCIFETYE